jgi:hypothetical protein
MIVSFSVSNFGVIKESVKLDFEATDSSNLESYYVMEPASGLRLLKIMFLYGPNASGKSTLLRALDFLRLLVLRPLGDKEDELDFSPFAFKTTTPKKLSTMRLDFVVEGYRYTLDIAFDKWHIEKETLSLCREGSLCEPVYERITTDEELAQIDYQATDLSEDDCAGLRTATLWNNLVLGGYKKINASSKHLDRVHRWFREYLQELISPEGPSDIETSNLTLLRSLGKSDIKFLGNLMNRADFGVSSIRVTEPTRLDLEELNSLIKEMLGNDMRRASRNAAMLKKRYEAQVTLVHENGDNVLAAFPLQQESLGTRRYLQLMLHLMQVIKHEKVQSIDELESSLHPDLYEYIVKVFLASSRGSQLLIATHNRELLKQEDLLRWDAVWFMQRQSDGGVYLFSAADYEEDALTKGVSLYNAYRAGRLGAVPLLEDCYIDFFGDGTGAHK